ncbi:hypothetical protein Pla22_33840 [Rubripirellula amarantea]|uniref:DUF1697 domain-containing protein n=1 Tax=Rubripirellula amarantea TaxID=2527999 RepID=A0A5C5WKS6_9BACT|nr:DUF1697 domain-containing protein [Rubripirellula amarantea]TWT50641.1 hypothetical protein Pla22_33840 [Rubripirellula amarantea]
MPTWIALFRGINVGGHNRLPMVDLAHTLEVTGLRSVRTYIQSGNVIFESSSTSKRNIAKQLSDAVEDSFKFRPGVLVLSGDELSAAIDRNPYTEATVDPKTLHFYFLETVPDLPPDEAISKMAKSTERYRLIDTVFYLHAPDGVGRSKLASGIERQLGIPTTARNYNTVARLAMMLDVG